MIRVSDKEWQSLADETKKLYVDQRVKIYTDFFVEPTGTKEAEAWGALSEMARTLIMIFRLSPGEMDELKKEAARRVKAYGQAS
mgnify:FL=1